MILLVTIDGLDWAALDRAVRDGRLPTAAALVQRGGLTRLRPDVPAGGCAWWVSLATGASPEEHGVTYPLEAWAGGLRRVSHASWRRPPVWEVLEDRGVRTASVAFPHAWPGQSWRGCHVDGRILDISGLGWDDWPLPLDVAPDAIREDLRSARVHMTDVPPAMIAPFEQAAPREGQRRQALVQALARASTLFGAVDVVAAHAAPQFLAVHIDWPASFASALGVTVADLPGPFWSLFEGGLWKLAQLAGTNSTIVLVSPGAPGRAGFAMTGGRVAQPGRTLGVLDIAPHLLACFGEAMPREAVARTATAAPDPADLRRVESFGNVVPAPPAGWPAPKLIAEAEALLATDLDAANAKASEALALAPAAPRALAVAGLIAFARSDHERLEGLAKRMEAAAPDHLWTAMLRAGCHVLDRNGREAGPLLRRVEAEGDAGDRLRVAAAWLMLGRGSEAERLFEAILAEQPDCVPALLGLASRKARRPFDQEQLLRRVLAIDPSHEQARAALAGTLRDVGRGQEADGLTPGPGSAG